MPLYIPEFDEASRLKEASKEAHKSTVTSGKFVSNFELAGAEQKTSLKELQLASGGQSAKGIEQQMGYTQDELHKIKLDYNEKGAEDLKSLVRGLEEQMKRPSGRKWKKFEEPNDIQQLKRRTRLDDPRLAKALFEKVRDHPKKDPEFSKEDWEKLGVPTVATWDVVHKRWAPHFVKTVDGKLFEPVELELPDPTEEPQDGLREPSVLNELRDTMKRLEELTDHLTKSPPEGEHDYLDSAEMKVNLGECKTLFVELCTALKGKEIAEISKHIENLHYVLVAEVVAGKAEDSNDGNTQIRRDNTYIKAPDGFLNSALIHTDSDGFRWIPERDGWTLSDFAQRPEAKECSLSLIEVASLRLYTTSTYTLINNPLRSTGGKGSEELRGSKHPMAVTTEQITKGLKKLRALNFRDIEGTGASMINSQGKDDGEAPAAVSGYLWRGMKDVIVTDEFMSCDKLPSFDLLLSRL